MSERPQRIEGRRGRIAKACSQCRAAKTRCTFSDGAKTCDKCLQRGLECSMVSLNAMNGQINGKKNSVPEVAPAATSSISPTVTGRASPAPEIESPLIVEPATARVSPTHQQQQQLQGQPNGGQSGDGQQGAEQPSADLPGGSLPGGALSSIPSPPPGAQYTGWIDEETPPPYQDTDGPGNMHSSSESTLTTGLQLTSISDSISGRGDPSLVAMNGDLPGNGKYNSDSRNMHDPSMAGGLPPSIATPEVRPSQNSLTVPPAPGSGSVQTSNLIASPSSNESMMQIDPIGEYFLNLGVFSDPGTKEILQSRSQSPSNDPMLNPLLNPLASSGRDTGGRFKFQTSAASMVLHSIDPILRDRLGTMSQLFLPLRRVSSRNVVNQRILSYGQVVELFGFFKGNYNHWISLPDAEPEELANYLLEQCPLLVTTCCCIALRFGAPELWQSIYPSLVRYLTYELAQTLVTFPQNIECLQALTILAKYADALSYGEFVFDMWYISGIGIQHLETIASLNDQFTYIHMRLWNHLVLAHLASANVTGRCALVDAAGLQMCRRVLDEKTSTRFDSCMVAELMVQSLTNEYLSHKITFSEFERGIAEWQGEWGILAQLPMIQFVEPVLLFCCFLARWNHTLRCFSDVPHSPPVSPRGDDYPLSAANNMSTQTLHEELANLDVIIKSLLSMVHADYFAFLSDSLHSIGFISAVMSLVVTKVIVSRVGPIDGKQRWNSSAHLVSQLAQRFRGISRGQDIFQTRCIALTQLLKSNAFV